MQFVLPADVPFYYAAVALVEVSQFFQQFFVGLVDSPYEVGKLVFLEVLAEGAQAVLHKFVDFDGVVVFMGAVDGQADGADQALVLAVGVDADEARVLAVGVAVVRFYELFEAPREFLHLTLD